MRIIKISALIVLSLILLMGLSASAAQLTVSTYSMFNGAHGSYDYRDFTYVPCNGVCDDTGAALSGGTGKLTDGDSPSMSWYQYGELTPWVGWEVGQLNGSNPTVTFNFASAVTINSVTVWLDNSDGFGAGGVDLPSSVSIGGMSFAITPNNIAGPQGFTFNGLNLTGSSVDVQFFQADQPWLMVGEVTFNGGSSVPEPTTMTLVGSGLAMAWWKRRKARP